ncbi:hypothetical protein AB0G71_28665 [Streptomyces sp. NPDC020403]
MITVLLRPLEFAHLDLFRWLHRYRYNTVRRHPRLGHRSLIAYGQALRTT